MIPHGTLSPKFHNMPRYICDVARWVVWKDAKVPYCATALNSKASSTNPATWSTFEQAQTAYEEGGYAGVGFVLSGDGIVGIDLDKCVQAGKPDTAALDMLGSVGCQYIEFSPSGTGLRGLGFGEDIGGRRGLIDGLKIELYSSKRYLTITGHTVADGPLVQMPGFLGMANAIRPADLQKRTEDDKSNLLYSSVGVLPASTIPTEPGQRNKCLFELARYLKGTMPHATPDQLRAIVLQWHSQHLSVIGTKDPSVTLTDFFNGWAKVKHPYGATINSILEGIDHKTPLPPEVETLGYGAKGHQLVRICVALQAHHGDAPFFLGARKAGDELGIHYTDAAKILSGLVRDGVLTLVSKGSGNVASRYMLKMPP